MAGSVADAHALLMPLSTHPDRGPLPYRASRCLIDAVLLGAASLVFAGLLTTRLQTGQFGFRLPTIPYQYDAVQLTLHLLLAIMPALTAMILLGRLQHVRRRRSLQHALFLLTTLLAIRLGPPDPQVFGATWTTHEVTMELFVMQWAIVVPVAVAALVLRVLLQALLAAGPARSAS